MIAPLVALMISAAPQAGAASSNYPEPTAIRPFDELKYASGRIASIADDGHSMQVVTSAGLLTLKTDRAVAFTQPDAVTADPNGVGAFSPGEAVRVYYQTGDGAQAREIDLAQTP